MPKRTEKKTRSLPEPDYVKYMRDAITNQDRWPGERRVDENKFLIRLERYVMFGEIDITQLTRVLKVDRAKVERGLLMLAELGAAVLVARYDIDGRDVNYFYYINLRPPVFTENYLYREQRRKEREEERRLAEEAEEEGEA